MKAMTKSELADCAGVSRRTFSRWLSEHAEELILLGVKQKSHILPPKAVAFVCEEYGIDIT